MPRKCSICSHEKAEEINSLVAGGSVSFRNIAQRYGMDVASVSRHVSNCLSLEISALIKEKKIKRAINHYEEITDQLEYAKELRLASREYLTDPETGKLALFPRSDEINVVYEDYSDLTPKGEPKKKTDTLDVLLERIVTGNINPTKTISKHVDIRSFALNAISTTDTVLDKIAKLEGLYQQDRPNDAENYKRAVQQLVENKTVKSARDGIDLFKEVGYPPPNEAIEQEIIKEHGTIG